ncbi:exodeoxyribonuclease V subunit gamma [Escherichia coli]
MSPPANWQVNRMQTSQGMCQHQRYASFTGQRRRDDPPALPESSVVRSRYVKGLPFQSSGRAGSVDGVYCRTERLDDPFEPEMILVQSTGMAQWLQMTLSQKFGIAANIDFPLPASFIWDMFVRCYRKSPKRAPLTNRA